MRAAWEALWGGIGGLRHEVWMVHLVAEESKGDVGGGETTYGEGEGKCLFLC